jgi:hypothetical protein
MKLIRTVEGVRPIERGQRKGREPDGRISRELQVGVLIFCAAKKEALRAHIKVAAR